MQQQEIGKTVGLAVIGLVMGLGALAMFKGKSPEEIAACNAQLECVGRKKRVFAEADCQPKIEALALHDVKWEADLIFSRYRWKDEEQGVVTYIGNAAKFQNGFGAWSRASYECDVDIKAERVLDVRAW